MTETRHVDIDPKECLPFPVNGHVYCPKKDPDKSDICVTIDDHKYCEIDGTTVVDEARVLMNHVLYPKLHVSETKFTKTAIIDLTIGAVLGALVYTIGIYIVRIIDSIILSFVPTLTTMTVLVVISVLVAVTLALGFIKYRATEASTSSRIAEKLAEKTPKEVLGEILKGK